VSSQHIHKYCVLVALMLAFVVIVLGAYTRLVDAGLGCPDWPGCYGHLVMPATPEEIQAANEKFEAIPFDVTKAVPEVVHRFVAGTLGLLVLTIVVISWRSRKALLIPMALLVLVIFQAALGAWTVTLKLWPQVVTAHLIGGFSVLAVLFMYALKENYISNRPIKMKPSYITTIFSGVLLCQIILGGWTSANYAALACPDFPLCHGELVPEMNFKEGFNVFQDIGPNYLGGDLSSEARIAVQVTHRLGALLVLIFGVWLILILPRGPRLHFSIFLFVQIALGILNVVLHLPLYIAVLHNLGAALLMLSTLQIYLASREPPPQNSS